MGMSVKDEFMFYFSLDEENDEGAYKFEKHTFDVVAVDQQGAQRKNDIDVGQDADFENKREELESDYGVHDVEFTPATQFYGFTTYEVEENDISELIEKWKAFFESIGLKVQNYNVKMGFEEE